MSNKKITIGTVFSGIGAPEQALLLENYKINIAFACDNGEIALPYSKEEIIRIIGKKDPQKVVKDLYRSTKKVNYMKTTYFANYKIKEKDWYDDIRFLDGNKYKGILDLFVGGSPCQSFSNMGKRRGLDDTRGTLFYEFARLIKEIQPKVFIYENVRGMLNHDGGNTWETIKSVFESLGYKIFYSLLNSVNYGVPQNRIRLFVVGFKNKNVNFKFPNQVKLNKTSFDYLDDKVDVKYYLPFKGFRFVTSHTDRACIDNQIIRTQKANQQFNWNGDFFFEGKNSLENKQILGEVYTGNWNNKIGAIRKLTPRECFRLMGFPDSFIIPVPDAKAYRQAGNSIVVDVLRRIIKSIEKSGAFNE